jgi:hypothetical protein
MGRQLGRREIAGRRLEGALFLAELEGHGPAAGGLTRGVYAGPGWC